ncbi:MAG: hypothetical protein ACO2ZZ_13685, partial [Cyclobacteriaceae bacterium]
MKKYLVVAIGFSLVACSTEVVKEDPRSLEDVPVVQKDDVKPQNDYKFESQHDSKELKSGLVINW